jgi:hypothetical protein
MSLADNPEALGKIIEHLGGTPIPHERFRFEIPLSEARRVIPEINRLNIRCEKVGERQGSDLNGRACSYATIELKRPPEPTEYDDMRHLMWAAVR